jgi:hypothetical protein
VGLFASYVFAPDAVAESLRSVVPALLPMSSGNGWRCLFAPDAAAVRASRESVQHHEPGHGPALFVVVHDGEIVDLEFCASPDTANGDEQDVCGGFFLGAHPREYFDLGRPESTDLSYDKDSAANAFARWSALCAPRAVEPDVVRPFIEREPARGALDGDAAEQPEHDLDDLLALIGLPPARDGGGDRLPAEEGEASASG